MASSVKRGHTLVIDLLTTKYSQNYWSYGLCPQSGILKARKKDVSGKESVSVLVQ
jgi:hypothetical protein